MKCDSQRVRSAGLCAASAVLLAWASALAAADRPNILFLMADQFRADCIGAEGNRVIRTPNLDRIAAEGARFRCAYILYALLHPGAGGAC